MAVGHGRWLRALVLTIVCLAAPVGVGEAAAAGGHRDLKVVASIKPVHALVAGVLDGIAVPRLLVTGSASPHTFTLTPDDARALHEADVFFRVSPAVEPFTVKIMSALPASVRGVTLADAPGISRLALRRSDTFEEHAHDDGHEGHDGDPAGEPVAAAAADGHIWLDPENAKSMVAEIARVLTELSPDDAERIAANAARVTADIAALDVEIKASLAGLQDRRYVVFHDAYQYFEHHYGLRPVGAITVGPEAQPGARRLSEIRRKLVELGAVCVFAEPQFSQRAVAAITEGTPARSGTLDPEGALVAPGPQAYGQLMRKLATNLRGCLAQKPAGEDG